MLILKSIFLGMALFVVGNLIYMLSARLIRPGLGVISTDSPFLWMAFVLSLALGCFISIRGLWIFEGLLLGLVMFIAEVVVFWIAYARSFPQSRAVAVGVNVSHLMPWFGIALISSVGLGLAIVRIWPTKGIPVP